MYPVRLLYEIGGFDGILAVDSDWCNALNLTEEESDENSLQTVVWLCSMLSMNPEEGRALLNEFKSSRTLTGNNPVADRLTTPTVPTSTSSRTKIGPIIPSMTAAEDANQRLTPRILRTRIVQALTLDGKDGSSRSIG